MWNIPIAQSLDNINLKPQKGPRWQQPFFVVNCILNIKRHLQSDKLSSINDAFVHDRGQGVIWQAAAHDFK
jgi:hypothetical protein